MKRVVHWSGSEVGQITSANMRQVRQQLREIQLRVPDRVGDRCWSGSRRQQLHGPRPSSRNACNVLIYSANDRYELLLRIRRERVAAR
jgi:hypothetical protein